MKVTIFIVVEVVMIVTASIIIVTMVVLARPDS